MPEPFTAEAIQSRDDEEKREEKGHGFHLWRCEEGPHPGESDQARRLDAAAGQPEEEDTAMTFSMELRALECPVCFIPFETEVYVSCLVDLKNTVRCKNGHGACAGCCIRSNRKCWSCCEPIGDIRNRQLETLAAMITPCKFARYGCGETVKYTDKRGHEETCAHAPCDCQFDGGGFRERDLYDHFRGKHQDSAVKINNWETSTTMTLRKGAPFLALLDPDSGRVFLLRNGGDVLEGRSLSLLWLGPRTKRDMELKYTMEVSGDGPGPGLGEGALALSASGTAPCARRLEGFLFVPDAYWGSNGTVSVRLGMEKRISAKPPIDQGAAKKARTLRNRKAAMAQKEQQQDEGEDPSRTLNVSLDLDTLECPLCFSPFEAPVFQCKNGHAACEACCVRIKGTCPCCGEPTGKIRCRPLEKAIAGMVVPCAFAAHGCAQRLRYAEKRAHEALLCQHAPCACPLPGCAYSGLLLHDHIRDAHAAAGGVGGGDDVSEVVAFALSAPVTLRRSAPFRVLLHAVDTRVFLLLNGGDVPSGRSLSVVCLGRRPAGNRALQYRLEVGAGEPGALSLSASGPVACTRRWAGHHPTDGFLFVPDAYWSSSGSVSVIVHCKNLHNTCAGCCIRLNRKCRVCSEPIGDVRNSDLEIVLGRMTSACRFKSYGCGETMKNIDKRRHEETCGHAPYDCPFNGCGFGGLDLYTHVRGNHGDDADCAVMVDDWGTAVTLRKGSPFLVLVHPRRGRVFLLLNGGDVVSGRSLSLLCVGPRPRPEQDEDLEYTMEVSGAGLGAGALALSASGAVPCARRLEGFQPKGFLFVPDAYWGCNGTVSVKIIGRESKIIWK
ncbi:hypothetical protein U9M48_020563 [Paspalum notatum var. saurae]|uniref:RING-type E3 ubiquitin transferase n=1 Tax=Paspalum notatum var. saurae TaxID=547442 RepID=A0AAQ3TF19_PASNO